MLSLVIPTLNEAKNLPGLLEALQTQLTGMEYELLVVDDDSLDGTWKVAEELSREQPRIRVLRRIGRRGLSSAVVEGFAMARGDTLMVIDADGQHDPATVRQLYDAIRSGAMLAVASRYVEGGDTGEWEGSRLWLSRTATSLARRLPRVRVSDPMSGFFAVKKEAFNAVADRLRPTGFKILLELLTHLPAGTKVAEVPLHFGMRLHGESKMSLKVEILFLLQLARIAFIRLCTGRLQWIVCTVLCAALAVVFLLKILPFLPLYADAAFRNRAIAALRTAADNEGFLLSEFAIDGASTDALLLTLRRHHRGPDEQWCLTLDPSTSSLEPCAD